MNRIYILLGLLGVLFAVSSPLQAIPCSDRLPGQGLTGSESCLNGLAEDDTLGTNGDKAFDLNLSSYFGFSDWVFLQEQSIRPRLMDVVVDVDLSISQIGNYLSGKWSIVDTAWDNFEDIAIVLMSDIRGEDMVFWSAYILQDQVSFGDWHSGGRRLSSISVFGREAVVPIPEPGTLGLLLLGLFGVFNLVSAVDRSCCQSTQ